MNIRIREEVKMNKEEAVKYKASANGVSMGRRTLLLDLNLVRVNNVWVKQLIE